MDGMLGGVRAATAVRYAAVSVAGVGLTQFLLVAGHAVAVLGASVPMFFANRAWVWAVSGPSSVKREIAPFWGFTIAGLFLSTLVVGGVGSLTDWDGALALANIGAFGVLWVAKFFVLDTVVFAPTEGEDLAIA